MRIKSGLQNFILCLLIPVLLFAAGNTHLPASAPENASLLRETASLQSCSSFLPGTIDFWTRQTSGNRQNYSGINPVQNTRTGVPGRCAVLFLFHILTLLSFISVCSKQILTLYDSRYVYRESFLISFMQDMDGRKRTVFV
ncbi:MAG: hypothetical protein HFI91_12455 [Lachnospiraceae bacterium]|nr:hypothetical protein [Lachnospiraceae bacterium]